MCGNQYPQKSILPGALCNCRCQCQPIISPHHTAEFKNFSSVMKFNRNKSFCQNPFMRKLVFYNISFFLFKDNTGSCSFSLKTCSNTNLLILSQISSPVYCERCKCEMRSLLLAEFAQRFLQNSFHCEFSSSKCPISNENFTQFCRL